jgi:hypothetical protein
MNEAERIARAQRAEAVLDEFLAPMFANLREEYLTRLAEVAATELHPINRADKITSLSVALKIVGTLESGMAEIIRDGELAKAAQLKAERIEGMSDAQQRLLKIVGY